MEDFFTCTANYGFPMVLAAYLLLRIEGKIDALTVSIRNLNDAIEKW